MSFKCLAKVQVSRRKTILQGNDLRFLTPEDAEAFCKMISDPPHVIKDWRIKEVPEPANYRMKDGILTPLTEQARFRKWLTLPAQIADEECR